MTACRTRIAIFPGKAPVFVELKTDTGKLSALQAVQIRRLGELGQKVYVIYGIDGVSQFFQDEGYEETSKAAGLQIWTVREAQYETHGMDARKRWRKIRSLEYSQKKIPVRNM